jgi:hypothetical protein
MDGQLVAQVELPSPDGSWPDELEALAPGEYVARVEVAGLTRRESATSTFRVATSEETASEDAARALLSQAAAPDVASLLAARRLLRLRWYDAAERELEAALASPVAASEALELARLVGTRTGYQDGWQVPPR